LTPEKEWDVRIGIIGVGHIGGTLAKHFVDVGHEVAVSNSRGPETLTGLVEEPGPAAQAMAPADAERFKAFNAIVWTRLRDDGRPSGAEGRIGIPISGDDEQAKQTVAELIDQIGFDAVDAGTLAAGGRKHQPGGPAYTHGLPTAELRTLLGTER
jgi:predicted dinucleotide-binding enzyme